MFSFGEKTLVRTTWLLVTTTTILSIVHDPLITSSTQETFI